MFKNISRRLVFNVPAGDEGGGSAPEPVPFSEPAPQQQTSENPAWAPYLHEVPEPLRPTVKNAFTKWDQDVNTRFSTINQQYEPYKPLIDQKIPADDLQKAWGMAQMLQEDPHGFVKTLAGYLGITLQEAQAVAEQVAEEQPPEEEVNPRVAQLEEQLNQVMGYITQREQAQQQQILERQQEQQIGEELAALEKRVGKLSPTVQNEILREALRISTVTNKPVSMEEAYSSLNAFVQEVRRVPSPGDTAPQVLSGSNGIPLTPAGKTPGQYTPKETRQAAAELAARFLAGSD